MMPETLTLIFIFLLGALIGSFLNVCIVRLPHGQSIAFPRSHCPKCKKMIGWFDNVPLLSYIVLGGKCRFCKEKISIRYFCVELITALGFVAFYSKYGFDILLLPYLIFFAGLIVSTFIDLELRIIPDEVSVGGIFLGLLLSIFIPSMHSVIALEELNIARFLMMIFVAICILGFVVDFWAQKGKLEKEDRILMLVIFVLVAGEVAIDFLLQKQMVSATLVPFLQSAQSSLIGILIGGGIIYAMGILGDFIFKKESMGGGDIKLLAAIGAFLGWKFAILTFFLAPFFGSVIGIIEKIRTKDSAIAYGPFLAIAAIISLFFGQQIIDWILNNYGFSSTPIVF